MMNLRQLIFCKPNRRNGFTLVELLVSLTVSAIILGGVATFAFAISYANDAAGDTREKQAYVRYATLRISELIKHCKLICDISDRGVVIWRADDNGNEQIDIDEIVTISWEMDKLGSLYLNEYYSSSSPLVPPAWILSSDAMDWLSTSSLCTSIQMIPQCSNVEVVFDSNPPRTRFVSISFDLLENGVTHHYQVNAALRSRPNQFLVERVLSGGGGL